MQRHLGIIWMIFVLAALQTEIVHGDPDPMARPTRPKVFTSPEELRRYLDHVRDYYSLNGKARYGKRAEVIPTKLEGDHTWDMVRTILDVHRQMQQQQREYGETAKNEKMDWLHTFEDSNMAKHPMKLSSRPTYLLDIIEKYYDDVQ